MDRKTALETAGFVYENGTYRKFICETEEVAYTLTTELNGVTYKVDKKLADGTEVTNGAGQYVDSPLGEKIKAIVNAVNENLKKKAPVDNLRDGGFEIEDKEVQEIVKEPEQKWVKPEVTKQLVKTKPIPMSVQDRQIQDLTFQEIKTYICPEATDSEAYMFLKLCQARNLNPFTGEAYLVKYGNDKAQFVTGKEAFTRRAEQNPRIVGWQAGIIVRVKAEKDKPAGEIERREGSFILPEEELLGGWANVWRDDKTKPFIYEISFLEYVGKKRDGTISKMWREKPATMIRKDALVGGLREAAPSEFSGMYDAVELGAEEVVSSF